MNSRTLSIICLIMVGMVTYIEINSLSMSPIFLSDKGTVTRLNETLSHLFALSNLFILICAFSHNDDIVITAVTINLLNHLLISRMSPVINSWPAATILFSTMTVIAILLRKSIYYFIESKKLRQINQ